MVRVLTFTTLFPNKEQPNLGVFVENRLRHTLALGGLDATVLAPVPFFPFRSRAFGRYAAYARVPPVEIRKDYRVLHPPYLVVPKVGMALAPWLLFQSAWQALRAHHLESRAFDVIDAHYFYPDGVAAAHLARRLELPLVITGRGSDLTLIPDYPLARAQIRWAAKEATALVTVCEALKRRLMSLGVSEDRVFVMRNGVDLDLFRPKPRDELRTRLGLKNFTLLSVGSLIPRKAHHLVIEALTELSDCTLVIVGEGPTRNSLEHLVHHLGLSRRVMFWGEVPHDGLADLYGAADALVLASESEGWANVLLESMACGTPVIASDVGGSGEVVRAPAAGILIASRTPAAIASAVRALRANPVPRQATRAYAEQYGWRGVAEANRALLFALAARTPIAPDARNFLVDRKTAPML